MRGLTRMLVVGALVAAGGCAAGASDAGGRLDGEWVLARLGDLEMHGGIRAPTLAVADGAVSGFAGVNRFTGSLASEGPFLFTPLATTRMAGPGPAMELENHYLAALQLATAFRIEGEELVLLADGDAVLGFRRASGGD